VSAGADRAAFACVGAFVDELARAGVRHVCVAPGSRSTPLALTMARHPDFRTWVHLDERSAAFFALGMARVLGTPVALVCTSGTAAANFFPAIVEAHSDCVPLLVLTADRPHEMRDVGAAQTIDQIRLYGNHVKWFVDVAIPEATPELVRYARTLAGRATAMALAMPAGPVHLNFPFREPLVPVPGSPPKGMSESDELAWHGRPGGAPWVAVANAVPAPTDAMVHRLATQLRDARRPLLICGPQPDRSLAEPLAELARSLSVPLLVDPLSQLRWGMHDRSTLIDRYDAALRHDETARALDPDLVVRFGRPPTSKPLLQYLQRHATATQIVIDAARWSDPTLLASEMLHADARLLCEGILSYRAAAMDVGVADTTWLAAWRQMDNRAGDAISSYMADLDEIFEGRVLAEVAALAPADGTLFVSSSMPVRDLDAFASGSARRMRVLANRGANGIDGVLSTALGASAALREADDREPLVLVIGDLAFYHDMNGLLAAKLHGIDATIVIVNNDGGGIFSFLPQAADAEYFEQLFGTPHGLDMAPAAALYDARYTRADTWDALRQSLDTGTRGRGLHIIEVRTDRTRNVALHREAWSQVAAALEDASVVAAG